MKKILSLALLLCSAVLLADKQPFRSGILLAAELSSVNQQIKDFDAEDYPGLPQQNRIYAAVTLKLFPGRQLSRHDYSLRVFGSDFKCAAIKVDNGPWISVSGDIKFPESHRKYTMLFILDSRVVGLNDQEKLNLKCNYPPAKSAETEIIFNNRKTANFTPASKIPESGILTIKK